MIFGKHKKRYVTQNTNDAIRLVKLIQRKDT